MAGKCKTLIYDSLYRQANGGHHSCTCNQIVRAASEPNEDIQWQQYSHRRQCFRRVLLNNGRSAARQLIMPHSALAARKASSSHVAASLRQHKIYSLRACLCLCVCVRGCNAPRHCDATVDGAFIADCSSRL